MNWQWVIVFVVVTLGALYAQRKHYEYLEREKSKEFQDILGHMKTQTDSFTHQMKGFEDFKTDYKRKVDTLVMKVGFKA